MISPQQMQRLRSFAAAALEVIFPTTITFEGRDFPAARWKASAASAGELGGLLPEADASFRVRKSLLPPGYTFREGRTEIREGSARFRVMQVIRSNGDPCVVLVCKAL